MSSLFEMRSRSFGRLIWKEFRQFRALILTLVAAGLMLQVGTLTLSGYGMLPVLLSAGVIPILCGLAIAATMFAGEHESGTFLGLRALPASQFQIVLAKFAVAAGGALVSFLTLWLLVFALRKRLVGPEHDLVTSAELGTWLFSSLATLAEILIAGTWISLKERRVLPALIKSGAIVAAIRLLAIGTALIVCSGRFDSLEAADRAILGITIAVRTLAFAGIAVALYFDLARWFHGAGPAERASWLPWIKVARPTAPTIHGPVEPGGVRRLIWLQIRYIGWWVGIPVVFAVTTALLSIYRIAEPTQLSGLALGLAVWSVVVLGAVSFAAANANRTFLAQIGASPRGVWIIQCALPSAVAVISIFVASLARVELARNSLDYAFNLLLPTIASFSWSLLISMHSRSPITAIAKSVAVAVAITLGLNWAVRGQLSVAWILTLAGLLTLYPVVEGWWRAPAWLNGTESSRWRWPLIRLGLACLPVAYGLWRIESNVPHYTNLEIATALNGGEPPETASYEEIQKLAHQVDVNLRSSILKHGLNYRFPYEVKEIQVGHDVVHDWVESSQYEMNQLMQLPYKDMAILALATESDSDMAQVRRARFIEIQLDMFFSAAFLDAVNQSDVELAESLLLHNPMAVDPMLVARWAWLPGNDSSRLRHSIRSLEAMGDQWELIVRESSTDVLTEGWPVLRRTRGSDLLERWAEILKVRQTDRNRRFSAVESGAVLREWARQIQHGVPLYRLVSESGPQDPSHTLDESRDYNFLMRLGYRLTQRRALILQLAAIAWARDHAGSLPESLSNLVGDYITEMPLDPWTGQPFVYEPNANTGIPEKFLWVALKSDVPVDGILYSPSGAGASAVRLLTRQWRAQGVLPGTSCPIHWHYVEGVYWFKVGVSEVSISILRQEKSSAQGQSTIIPLRLRPNEAEVLQAPALAAPAY